jgi:hypothetical protein
MVINKRTFVSKQTFQSIVRFLQNHLCTCFQYYLISKPVSHKIIVRIKMYYVKLVIRESIIPRRICN